MIKDKEDLRILARRCDEIERIAIALETKALYKREVDQEALREALEGITKNVEEMTLVLLRDSLRDMLNAMQKEQAEREGIAPVQENSEAAGQEEPWKG